MPKKRQLASMLLILVMVFLFACAPQAAPAPAPQIQAPAPVRAAPAPAALAVPARPGWEARWEETLAAARKEGKVIVNTVAGGDLRFAIMKIAKMQGIEAEVVSMRGPEFYPKILAERKAGLYLNDVRLTGIASVVQTAKPAGYLESLDSALILPHFTDPEVIKKTWYKGELPWIDRDHMLFAVVKQPGLAIAINTTLVKPDEVKSWRDVLEPKWRDKIAFNDPTVAGYGQLAVQTMVNLVGENYVRELANAKPIIIRDQRQLVEWLAHGKVAIAIAVPVEILVEFVNSGAPLKPVIPQEGTWLGVGNAGGLHWFKNPAHPNAAKVFINWLATKEAQEIFVKTGGFHSTRVDVSTAHLYPGLARKEGEKYFDGTVEEAPIAQVATDKLGRDLFGPLIK